MTRYRAIFTYEAPSHEAARCILPVLTKLPAGSSLRIENADRRRTLRMILVLGLLGAFWLAAIGCFLVLWRGL